jgi:endonuclease/exonuclease/phosphatase family metal-dependent hydrolase
MKQLRIATFNCLNLALSQRRTYEGLAPYSANEYLAKTQWVAGLFDRMAADLVLVQEVFHEAALNDVIRQTSAGHQAWQCVVPLAPQDNARPRLGMAWRRGFTVEVETLEALPPGCVAEVPELGPHQRYSRPLLRARVGLGAASITVFNIHLKSRRPEYLTGESPADPQAAARAQLRALVKRGAEAAAVRHLACESLRKQRGPVVIGGDFNDEDGAVTTRMIADTSWRVDDPVPDRNTFFNALDVEQHLRPDRSRDAAYTILHGGLPERIDHILVSDEFVPQSGHAIGRVIAVEVFSDHLQERRHVTAGGIDLQRIYSDHAAVCVTLELDSA